MSTTITFGAWLHQARFLAGLAAPPTETATMTDIEVCQAMGRFRSGAIFNPNFMSFAIPQDVYQWASGNMPSLTEEVEFTSVGGPVGHSAGPSMREGRLQAEDEKEPEGGDEEDEDEHEYEHEYEHEDEDEEDTGRRMERRGSRIASSNEMPEPPKKGSMTRRQWNEARERWALQYPQHPLASNTLFVARDQLQKLGDKRRTKSDQRRDDRKAAQNARRQSRQP